MKESINYSKIAYSKSIGVVQEFISYDEFERYLLVLKKELDKEEKVNDTLICSGLLERGWWLNLTDGKLLDTYVNMLENLVKDENSFISWFVWENDFGKKELDIDGKKIKTIKQLYNILVKEKK